VRSVLFLSGKGGTGKTSLAGAFAALAADKVLADCDVDAANLHLLLDPQIASEGIFQGIKRAVKDDEKCTSCGKCREVCRFHAIDEHLAVDPTMCEGCGACAYVCPVDAISLTLVDCGRWYTARSRLGPLAGAELYPGEETSGKLVFLVKEKAVELVKQANVETLLIDGAPGIGCPVIASVSGVSAVILVTEPSLSGLHDLKRILGVVRHFRIPATLVINKADLNENLSEEIEAFAAKESLPLLGRIPYDRRVTEAMIAGRSAVEDGKSAAGIAMRQVFERFMEVFR
jgi:MinD superfamily P-loop ATPase